GDAEVAGADQDGGHDRAQRRYYADNTQVNSPSPSTSWASAQASMLSSNRSILRSDSSHTLRSEPENRTLPLLTPANRPTSFTSDEIDTSRNPDRHRCTGVTETCLDLARAGRNVARSSGRCGRDGVATHACGAPEQSRPA